MASKTAHTGEKWQDQWDRLRRWHQRLQPIRAKLPANNPEKALALDDVFAFFMNCYHLQDWVKKDGYKTEQQVNDFIFGVGGAGGSDALRLCRDVCNGLKHYELQTWPHPPANPNWSTATIYPPTIVTSGRGASRIVGTPPPRWVFTNTVRGDWDMFDLADECVNE